MLFGYVIIFHGNINDSSYLFSKVTGHNYKFIGSFSLFSVHFAFSFMIHPPCFMLVIKASCHVGNYLDSLNDAKAAIRLQPVYMKALERGNFPNMSGNEMLAAR